MTEIFRLVFEQLTNQLTLALDPLSEYVVFALIGVLAYVLAYRFVGDLYRLDIIDGRLAGSAVHWGVRLILFVIFWAVGCIIICLYRFIAEHWLLVMKILGGTTATIAIVLVTWYMVSRKIKYQG